MNATVKKTPAKKGPATTTAKKASTKAGTSAKTRTASTAKSTKTVAKPAKAPAKPVKAAPATAPKPTAKPSTKKDAGKTTAAKSAVKSVAVKKTAVKAAKGTPVKASAKKIVASAPSATQSSVLTSRTTSAKVTRIDAVERKPAKSEVHVSNNNVAADFVNKMDRTVVSKVSEVATKTMKSTPVLENGALLTEEQILKMSEKDYMNPAQLAFFKARLQALEKELLKNAGETTEHLRETVLVPDPADRATIEEEHALELRTRDRERKLLKKVQQSLASIESGDYGWCEETGEPIGIPRLLARPTATLSLEAQQRRELKQKLYGD